MKAATLCNFDFIYIITALPVYSSTYYKLKKTTSEHMKFTVFPSLNYKNLMMTDKNF